MSQIVKLRRSSVSGQKPTNANLQLGELALNTTDGKVYMAKSGSIGPSVEELISTNTVNTGSIYLTDNVTASYFTGSFIGDGSGLYNIPSSGITGLNLSQISSGSVSASISPNNGLVINTNTTITGSLTVSGSFNYIGPQSITGSQQISGSISLYPTNDPDPLGQTTTATHLFVSASNNQTGEDLYIRQQDNLVKWKWFEGKLNSGILWGGALSYSGSQIFITKGSGIIIDQRASATQEISPVTSYVNWNDITASCQNLTSSLATYVGIDMSGSLYQQNNYFSVNQYRQTIPLGMFNHTNRSSITSYANNVLTAYDDVNQTANFIQAFGPIKLEGLSIIPQSGTTRLTVGSGESYIYGGFYQQNPNDSSHKITAPLVTPQIARVRRNGNGNFTVDNNNGAFYTTLDTTKWDDGTGTLNSLGGNYAIQRVFFNPFTTRVHVYYGQTYYGTKTAAFQSLASDPFSEAPYSAHQYVLLGYIIHKGGASDLSNTSEVQIIQAGLFRNTVGSGGNVGTFASLHDLDDVDIINPDNGDLLVYNSTRNLWEHSKQLTGGYTITGSLNITGGLTGSIDYSNLTNVPTLVSGSSQIEITGTTGYSTFSSSIKDRIDVVTGSITDLSSSIATTTNLLDGRIDSLETESGSIRSNFNSFTSSYTTGAFTGSFIGDGVGLYNIPASGVTGLQLDKIVSGNASASIDNTGLRVNRNVYIDGTLTAKELYIDYVTSSVLYQSGSTKFGDTSDDTHNFTGSVFVSGSFNLHGNQSVTGSLLIGTGSFHVNNPEILHVQNSGSYNIAHFQGNNQYYTQVNVKNTNSGSSASGDIVITADNGTENVHYVDLGINSSTYDAGYVGYANDGYLLNAGNDLYIGTLGGPFHPSNLNLFAQNSWENPQIQISGSKQISFNTGSVSSGYTYEFSGSIKAGHNLNVLGYVTANEFTGSALGLTNVPFHITGSDVDGGTYDKQFTKLHFDDSTGLNVSESVPGTAFISIGSHFRDIFVSGSEILRATGSDAFEIIPLGGVEITTSITDTNANGYIKELTISTTNLSSSINDRIDIITGSIDSLNSFSSSVVLTSETSSMTVLSASYALTAAFALNASAGGASGGGFAELNQTTPSTTWTFQHNLGQKYPIFQIFDTNDNVIIPSQILAVSSDSATITFPSAQSGRAIASLGTGPGGMTQQFSAATTWSLSHSMGTDYPIVTVYDNNRKIIFPQEIRSIDSDNIEVYFSAPVAGHLNVAKGGHIISGSIDLTNINLTGSNIISGSSQISNLGYATTGSNTFIGSQTINGCLTLNNAKICSTAVTISSNTQIFNLSSFDGAFFDYVVKSGSNMRAGTIMSAWDGTNATFNEASTIDLGNTSGIGFNVSGTGRLNATVSSGTWLVEVLYRALGSTTPQPDPTPTPAPTATPGPTPGPTGTPGPTATLGPTATPGPSNTPTATLAGSTIQYYRTQTIMPTSERVQVWARFNNGAWVVWSSNQVLRTYYETTGPTSVMYGSIVSWCFTKQGTEIPIEFGVGNNGPFTGYCGFNNPYTEVLNNQPAQPFYFNVASNGTIYTECVSVQPTATPTPTATPIPPTPTPTPSPTSASTNYLISNGSSAPDYCSGLFGANQTVYGNSSDWLTVTRFYTNSGMSTPFNGNSLYYGDSVASYGTTLQIDSSGYVINSYAC